MPYNRILPAGADSRTGEARIVEMPLPTRALTREERVEEERRLATERRNVSRFGDTSYLPSTQEDRMMQDATRKRIEERDQQKAAVVNTLTANGDIAKVASADGSTLVLTPTANTYLSDNPQEDGPSMEIEDNTVTLPGRPQGSTLLDQARMSLEQPKGDEFSSASARGPLLPGGAVLNAIKEGETTEVPFTPEMSRSERLEQIQEESVQASEAAREAEEPTPESEPKRLPTEGTREEVRPAASRTVDQERATKPSPARGVVRGKQVGGKGKGK